MSGIGERKKRKMTEVLSELDSNWESVGIRKIYRKKGLEFVYMDLGRREIS